MAKKLNAPSSFDRKEYEKKNFKYQNVCFKTEEMTALNIYCNLHGEPKNTLIRKAVMKYIGKPIDE